MGAGAGPWANFGAVGASLERVEGFLVHFDEQPAGEAVWNLAPGRYVVDLKSYNADWRYRLNCRE